ncbi:hypothetical protein D3C78_945310 [compost metagenome]
MTALNQITSAGQATDAYSLPLQLQTGEQRLDADALVAVGKDHPALNDVFQLADVARPGILLAGLDGAVGQAKGLLAVLVVELLEKVFDQQWDVLTALTQRRYLHREHIETVEQVSAETPSLHRLSEILVGRGYYPYVYLSCVIAADPLQLTLL